METRHETTNGFKLFLKHIAVVAVSCFFSLSIAMPTTAQEASDAIAPEFGTGTSKKELVTAEKQMVVTANPYATEAGIAMLREGGNAIDAMVAVQTVLGLVEPQSSGLGGGAFLVYWDEAAKKLTTFDGRETAPLEATPDLFLDDEGNPLKFFDAVIGGRSVGTPGTVKLLHETHKRYGKLDWKQVLQPAISLAETGFKVSPRLNQSIANAAFSLYRFPATRDYFLSEEGVPIFEGTLIKNQAYADTLKAVSEGGADAFYKGEIAKAIVEKVRSVKDNPGVLSIADFEAYEIKEREPVCASYRTYEICGMGPPSSGALTVGQILSMVEHYPLKELGPKSAESWRLIGEASRLAFADRGRYMADSDFVKMPKGLLDQDYLRTRSRLFSEAKTLSKEQVSAGDPPWEETQLWADDESLELPSTSHFSIVDQEGNVLSMTTTIENGFGSRLMVNGFLLNNELTDFSFRAERDGKPIANRVEPGKRPRSSMSPTIVMKDGKPYMAVGSPGGSRIIGYVTKTLIAHIDWGMDMQSAIELPHLVNRFGTYDLEEGTAAESFARALSKLGYEVKARNLNSGLHGIVIDQDTRTLSAGADPRREGVAIGD